MQLLKEPVRDSGFTDYDLAQLISEFTPRYSSTGSQKKPIRFDPDVSAYEHNDLKITNTTRYGKTSLLDRFFSWRLFGKRIAGPDKTVFGEEVIDTPNTHATLHLSYLASTHKALFGFTPLYDEEGLDDGVLHLDEHSLTRTGDVTELADAFKHFPGDFSIDSQSIVHREQRYRLGQGLTTLLRLNTRAYEQIAQAPVSHDYEHVLAITYPDVDST